MSDPNAPLIEPAPDSEPIKKKPSLVGRLLKVAAALFVLGGGAVVLGLVAVAYFGAQMLPDDLSEMLPGLPTPELSTPGADALRLDPNNSAHKADYVTIQMSLEQQIGAVGDCGVAVEGGAFGVELVVEADGSVSHASVSDISSGAGCATDALEAMTLERRGGQQVIFARSFEIE